MMESKAHGGALKVQFSLTARRWTGGVAAIFALAAPLAASQVAQAAPSAHARLVSTAKKHPKRKVTAIVQFKQDVTVRQARKVVRRHHGRVTDRLPAVKGFAVKLSARHARTLRRAKPVLNVTLNTRVRAQSIDASSLATNFPKTTGADQAWAAGITGKGIGVAIIDSGINGDLPDFKNADGTTRVTNVIANPGATTATDPVGHGTHVAGIVGGNGLNRTDAEHGRYVGIAPEADLIAIKTADDAGNSTVLDVINALQFVVDHKDELNIRVVNLSVSSDTPGSYMTDPLDAAVEFAWHAGLVVVSAAGNRGDAADAVQYAPGNDPFVISVGATDEGDTMDPADDTLASFSSRGVTQDGLNKPDVVAPGARIVAPLAAGSAFASLAPATSIVDGTYLRIGGTSMASPVVAGAAALVLQARPDLNPDQVKALLTQNVSGTAAGAGELNIPAALNAQVGAGANQGVQPNEAVEAALVEAGIDPTRATWTRATWTQAEWTRATWTRATWTRATWTADADGIAAPWARATWTCAACDSAGAGIDATRSTWSRSTWSRSTWSSAVDW
jgi:serine protease AprX